MTSASRIFQPDLLRERRILITGGGTGLGKAMAQRFLELGATVYICGRRHEVLAATVAELGRITPGKIHSAVCDVRDLPRVEEMISSIWKDGPLNIVVNNAAGNFMARTEELSPGAFEAVLGIVLMGTINVTMACGRKWLAAKHPGVFLNIAATYADTGSAYVVPSAMAKAGVAALTRSLAVEWGNRSIRMNAMPRPELEKFALDRNPLGRFGTPEELANLATFLVCDASGYVNGEVVVMDGGEWLQGAGEFSSFGRQLSDQDWELFKPRKK
jgi:NAD(P)-dependent dehydrogenase (short-subunit alcohol dehydrogenase family)